MNHCKLTEYLNIFCNKLSDPNCLSSKCLKRTHFLRKITQDPSFRRDFFSAISLNSVRANDGNESQRDVMKEVKLKIRRCNFEIRVKNLSDSFDVSVKCTAQVKRNSRSFRHLSSTSNISSFIDFMSESTNSN